MDQTTVTALARAIVARVREAGLRMDQTRKVRRIAVELCTEAEPDRMSRRNRFPGPRPGERLIAYALRVAELGLAEPLGRGRPPTDGPDTAVISVRLTEAEQADLTAWCGEHGYPTLAEGVRAVILRAILAG